MIFVQDLLNVLLHKCRLCSSLNFVVRYEHKMIAETTICYDLSCRVSNLFLECLNVFWQKHFWCQACGKSGSCFSSLTFSSVRSSMQWIQCSSQRGVRTSSRV